MTSNQEIDKSYRIHFCVTQGKGNSDFQQANHILGKGVSALTFLAYIYIFVLIKATFWASSSPPPHHNTMESILLKNMLSQNHTLQQVPSVDMDLSWLIEFLKGMVKPVCATAVVFLAVGLSFSQKLGLEVEMIVSILRAFLQLSIIGFVLQFIFNQDNSGWILLAYLFMVCSIFNSHFLCFGNYILIEIEQLVLVE